jgi:tetratricopeptide (TPR) repeat protein
MKLSQRLWAFRIATAIATPALLLLLTEGALRLIGYGHRSDFTVPCTVQGRNSFCENDRFTWQFFPPGLFRLPYSFAIPAEKRPGTFRIFIVGESAAQGVPEPSYGFARYLEVMLRDRFPSMTFEVVNTGISSINSHVLLPIARDLARRGADLFVLYIGNNEVVGPYGPQTTLTPRASSLRLIRTGIALKSTRVGQLLGGVFQARTKDSAPGEWRGIQMFLEHRVPADAPALGRVYQNFQHNLRDIIEVARRSGAPVLISTVGANLKDCAPFGSLHRRDLAPADLEAWQARVQEGGALEEGGHPAAALEQYLSAAAIDDRYAELQFRIGRVYWTLGQFAAARDRFVRARDLDVLRFRADSRMNEIIRSVAAAAGPEVELFNGEAVLTGASPHGVPGRELFYEHVHLNPQGNYLVARALYRSVVARLPADVRQSAASAEAPSSLEADRLLALTPFDRRRVAQLVGEWLSQPPFTYQLGNDEHLRQLQREAGTGSDDSEETAAAYRWAISRAPRDRWLRFNHGLFLEQREPATAAAEFGVALQLLPGDYRTREKLVDALLRMGRFDEAIAQCRELLRRMPYHAPAYLTIGYALTQLGSLDESIAAYARAIRLQPAFAVDGYNQIGIIQLHQGRFGLAAKTFQKAIELDNRHARTAELQHNLRYARAELTKGLN